MINLKRLIARRYLLKKIDNFTGYFLHLKNFHSVQMTNCFDASLCVVCPIKDLKKKHVHKPNNKS